MPRLRGVPWTAPTLRRRRVFRGEEFEARIAGAKQNDERAYLGRKRSYTRDQLNKVRDMLGQEAVSIAQIARETGLSRQTIYRIKDDPAGAEAALAAWNYNSLSAKLRATLG